MYRETDLGCAAAAYILLSTEYILKKKIMPSEAVTTPLSMKIPTSTTPPLTNSSTMQATTITTSQPTTKTTKTTTTPLKTILQTTTPLIRMTVTKPIMKFSMKKKKKKTTTMNPSKPKITRRKRRWWTLNKTRRRGNNPDMLMDLTKEPSGKLDNFCRMSSTDFEYLLSKIGSSIAKQNTNMRESFPVHERLAVALRFFASGDSYSSLAQTFNCSSQTVSKCVDDVCRALIDDLQEGLQLPEIEEEWLNIATRFEREWNFPNCIGAIDGKHIVVGSPKYRPTQADDANLGVTLLALVDANYCFTFVDIRCQVRISDDVFNTSSLMTKLHTGELNIPPDRLLPSSEEMLPYVFVSDSVSSLNRHMMTPYPGLLDEGSAESVFNYHSARVQRVVENVFGVISTVFRIFRKPILLDQEKVRNITLTCILLHNFMRRSPTSAERYTPDGVFDTDINGDVIPGSWRLDQRKMTSFFGIKKTPEELGEESMTIRNSFAEYFATSDKVSW